MLLLTSIFVSSLLVFPQLNGLEITDLEKFRLDLALRLFMNVPFLSQNLDLDSNSNNVSVADVKYYLYTRRNWLNGWNITDLNFAHVEPGVPVKMIVHGWTEHYDVEWARNMTEVYLKRRNLNVIIPDWSRRGDTDYVTASTNVKRVGEIISEFLVKLHQHIHVPYKSIHLVSHSLGCHVAGVVGQHVFKLTKQKLGRITALDPAAPIFDMLSSNRPIRLSGDDADFVDIIHTDGGRLGFRDPIGTVDFYPNGGIAVQPGCALTFPDVKYDDLFCSHAISHRFFTYTITHQNVWAMNCSNYDSFNDVNCNSGQKTPFGEHTFTNISGVYYVKTKHLKVFQ